MVTDTIPLGAKAQAWDRIQGFVGGASSGEAIRRIHCDDSVSSLFQLAGSEGTYGDYRSLWCTSVDQAGKGVARRLRRAGQLPAVAVWERDHAGHCPG